MADPITHPASPLRFVAGVAVAVEQDSGDHKLERIHVTCRTMLGERLDDPTFGIPSEVLRMRQADLIVLAAAIEESEPDIAAPRSSISVAWLAAAWVVLASTRLGGHMSTTDPFDGIEHVARQATEPYVGQVKTRLLRLRDKLPDEPVAVAGFVAAGATTVLAILPMSRRVRTGLQAVSALAAFISARPAVTPLAKIAREPRA